MVQLIKAQHTLFDGAAMTFVTTSPSFLMKEAKYETWFVFLSFFHPKLDLHESPIYSTSQVHQTQWKEGPPHLHRGPGLPPGALPWPHGECPCKEGRIRLPPGLRALSGTLQNALQTNLAPLERTCQVMLPFPPNQQLIVWLPRGSMEEILSLGSCQNCWWENTSVYMEECSRVPLTKAQNLRVHPGEWLCPALISCSGSGQLPGVMVWMWSRLSGGKSWNTLETNA